MPQFRKKPVVITAEQWFPGKQIEGVVLKSGPGYTTTSVTSDGKVAHHGGPGVQVALIETLEGELRVSPGDWIITGVKGEVYPCKPDIFEATYESPDSKTPTDNLNLPTAVCPIEIIDGMSLGEFPPPPNGFLAEAGKLLHITADTMLYTLNTYSENKDFVKSAEVTITPAPPEVGAKPGSVLYGYSLTTEFGIWVGETIVLEPHELSNTPPLILPDSVRITEMPEIVEPVDDLVDAGGYRL